MSNIFKRSSSATEIVEKMTKEENMDFNLLEENFPSLGGLTKTSEISNSFSDALNEKNIKKKKKKNLFAGWLVMKKNGDMYKHPNSDRFDYIKNELIEIKKNKRISRFLDLEAEREYNEKINIFLNGHDYINSWEVSDYLKKREEENMKEKKDEEIDYDYDYDDDYSD